jgi:hypothetical protein
MNELEIEVARLRESEKAAHMLRETVSALYDRMLADKDAENERLRSEVASLKGKIDLMELALMPLSSPAGAAYQDLAHPRKKQDFKTILETHPTDWQKYKSQKDKEFEDWSNDAESLPPHDGRRGQESH